ncbi:N-acetylmuramoyl-L-alanine amidase [Candidatus Woesearchaeota archaeon]|nr:N-acetylmuramoyl-L-alanine amidase [Candidatus Woesearchaeota archaeon]
MKLNRRFTSLSLALVLSGEVFSDPMPILSTSRTAEISQNVASKLTRPIILDPGHGGADHGTQVASTDEDEIAYDIAVRVKSLLEHQCYEVYQTTFDQDTGYRPQDKLTNGTHEFLNLPNGRHMKLDKPYLSRRCKLINSLYRGEEPILVSLHINSTYPIMSGVKFYYPSAELYGSQTVTNNSQSLGLALSSSIKKHGLPTFDIQALADLGIDFFPDLVETMHRQSQNGKPFKLGLFAKTPQVYSKVLIECGNLRNKTDEERLMTPSYRQNLAVAISDGIISYEQQ